MAKVASRCALALFFGALACAAPRWRAPATGSAALAARHAQRPEAVRVRSQTAQPARTLPPPAARPNRLGAAPLPAATQRIGGRSRDAKRSATPENLERDYPLHGLAFHVLAQVFSEPSERAVVNGYFRRGGRLRAKPAVRGKGCDTRWHAVLGGGYICAGRGFLVGKSPPQFSPLPGPPALHDALPYPYAKTTIADTPLYVRPPTPAEERDLALQLAAAKAQATPTRPTRGGNASRSKAAHTDQRLAKQLEAKPEQNEAAPPAPMPDFVRRLMQPGYYVSLDEAQPSDASPLLRTIRGDALPARGQLLVRASELHGTQIDPASVGQLALVYRAGAPSFTRDAMSGALLRAAPLQAFEAVYLATEVVRDRQREYRVAQDGRLLPLDALRLVPHTPRPPFVPAGARYIAVELSSQTLVAYDGPRAVFATLVSTGKAEHETPTGIFRIEQKHVSTTMDGEVGSDEAYSIEDVPWTMYFSGSLALHAAFWHERFGRPHSHGCVNLAPLDAHWLFDWAGPTLPAGFHGVVATRENAGTFVIITP